MLYSITTGSFTCREGTMSVAAWLVDLSAIPVDDDPKFNIDAHFEVVSGPGTGRKPKNWDNAGRTQWVPAASNGNGQGNFNVNTFESKADPNLIKIEIERKVRTSGAPAMIVPTYELLLQTSANAPLRRIEAINIQTPSCALPRVIVCEGRFNIVGAGNARSIDDQLDNAVALLTNRGCYLPQHLALGGKSELTAALAHLESPQGFLKDVILERNTVARPKAKEAPTGRTPGMVPRASTTLRIKPLRRPS